MTEPLNPITPGLWTCRDGTMARVYATDGSDHYPIHGAINNAAIGSPAQWEVQTWRSDGRFYDNSECKYDLISPYDWRQQLAPIWAVLDSYIKWLSMDKDGRWFGWTSEPVIRKEESIWSGGGGGGFPIKWLTFPTPTCDWTETLTARPESANNTIEAAK